MQAIVLDTGKLVGWFRDPHVVNPDGGDIGFVQGWGLFSYDGALRGYFEDGMFRDRSGLIVAKIGKSAQGSPLVDWTRARVKEPAEPLPIIPFFQQVSDEGWKEVFADRRET